MGSAPQIILVANAGLLLRFQGVTLLLDSVFDGTGHPFNSPTTETWSKMLCGEQPFECVDYLLVSHLHPDHFSAERTLEFLRCRKVKGLFLPELPDGSLSDYLRDHRIPCVPLSGQTDHAEFQVEPEISVRAFQTRHLDQKYREVPHFCFLLTLGTIRVLFTADVDYTTERFETLLETPLDAVFVNPLFFDALRRNRFFRGSLNTARVCVYHVPSPSGNRLQMRAMLSRALSAWSADAPAALVLEEPYQTITLYPSASNEFRTIGRSLSSPSGSQKMSTAEKLIVN